MAGISLKRLGYGTFREYARSMSEMMLRDGFYPEVIVGVWRGGAAVARAVSDIIDQGCVTGIRCEFYSDVGETGSRPSITQGLVMDIEGKRVLLCDDISDSGKSLRACKDHVEGRKPRELKTMSMYTRKGTVFVPDYVADDAGSDWIIFPGEESETIRKLVARGKKEALLECFTGEEIEKALYMESLIDKE